MSNKKRPATLVPLQEGRAAPVCFPPRAASGVDHQRCQEQREVSVISQPQRARRPMGSLAVAVLPIIVVLTLSDGAAGTTVMDITEAQTACTNNPGGMVAVGTTLDVNVASGASFEFDGHGCSLDGQNSVRILRVVGGHELVLFSNLTLLRGNDNMGDGGGGVRIEAGSTAIFSSCGFQSNAVSHDHATSSYQLAIKLKGGGAFIESSNLTYASCIFHANKFENNVPSNLNQEDTGAGMYVTGATSVVVLSSSTFSSNSAIPPQGTGTPLNAGYGGGAYFLDSSIELTSCVIQSNMAKYGVGVDIGISAIGKVSTAALSSCTFQSNLAQPFGEGTPGSGTINAIALSRVALLDCAFTSNINGNDDTNPVSLAPFTPAGVLLGRISETSLVARCEFTANKVVFGPAGALCVYQSTASIATSTFTANEATRGAAIMTYAAIAVFVDSCVFRENQASEFGSAIYAQDPSKLHFVGFNTATGNSANAFAGAAATLPNLTAITSCPSDPTLGYSASYITSSSGTPKTFGDFADAFYGCPFFCAAGRWARNNSDTAEATQCADCPAGFWSSDSPSAQCYACFEGRYHNKSGSTSIVDCEPCNKNRQDDAVFYACADGTRQSCAIGNSCVDGLQRPCQVGLFQDEEGSSVCKSCASGKKAAANATACESCLSGKFLGQSGTCQDCTPCDPGKYISAACSNANNQMCDSCGAGTYSDQSNSLACTKCSAGTFQASMGKLQCEACDPGSVQPFAGNTSCIACAVGRFQDNRTWCASCPTSHFQVLPGQQACTRCQVCSPGERVSMNCSASDDRVCAVCSAGFFSGSTNAPSCTACAQGKYQPNEKKPVCLPCIECAAGQYRSSGSCTSTSNTVCESCASGTFLNSTSEQCSSCEICPTGKYIEESCASAANTRCATCTTCTWGKYLQVGSCNRTKFAAGFCESCMAGATFMKDAGSCTPCSTCPDGKYLKTACTITSDAVCDTRTCIACAPGAYRVNGTCTESSAGVCAACPSGQIAAQGGALRCTACPDGTYAETASKPCEQCPAGYESLTGGQARTYCTLCQTCPVGTFNTDPSTCGNCANCPAGFVGTDTGSCRACKSSTSPGAYQSTPGKSFCLQCSTNAIGVEASFKASENGKACECADGYRFDAAKAKAGSANLACTICDTNRELCCQAFGFPFLRNRAGFWASPSTPGIVLACPVMTACNGVGSKTATCASAVTMANITTNSSNACAQGHEGLACTQCKPNYKPASDGACVFCATSLDDTTVVIAQLAIYWAATFLICSGIFVFGSSPQPENKEKQSLLSQEATVIISFCQVAASFGYTFSSSAGGGQDGMVLPPRVTAVCNWLAAGSVDFLALLKDIASPCTLAASFQANLTVRLLILPVLVSAAAVAYVLVSFICQRTREAQVKARARNSAVALANLLIFCLWPSVGGTLVRPFVCVNVGETSLVAGDLAVHCDLADPSYASMVPLSVVGLLCITIGIPCAYFVVLRRQDLGATQTKERFGALYEKYEPQYYFFDLVVMLYKFCMASVVLVLRQAPALQFIVAIFVALGYTFFVLKLQPYVDDSVDQLDQFVMFCTVGVLILGYVNTYSFRDQQGDDAPGAGKAAVENLCLAFILLACLGCLCALVRTILAERWPSGSRSAKKGRRAKVVPVTATSAAAKSEQQVEKSTLSRLISVRAARSQARDEQHSGNGIRRVLTRVHALGDAELAGEISLAEAERQKEELIQQLEDYDKADMVDMLLTDYCEEHAKAEATKAGLELKLEEEHKFKAELKQQLDSKLVNEAELELELTQMKRRASSKHLEKAADEVEARRIIADHNAEHEEHKAQLSLDQQASAARGERKRFKKRLRHLLKALVKTFGDLTDDAIVQAIDKDADGEISYTELFECMQQQSNKSDGNGDGGVREKTISAEDAQLILTEMDKDGDGTVGVRELLDAMHAVQEAAGGEGRRRHGQKRDAIEQETEEQKA